MDVVAAQSTDVGKWRQINEDSAHVGRSLWVVADGMGGHAAGDVASALAVAVAARLDAQPDITMLDLHALVAGASGEIRAYGEQHPEAHGLGTTIAGIALIDEGWVVFNVGDSRVYRFRHGVLELASVDHTEVELLVRAGVITAEEARRHPGRNVVTRSLGSLPAPAANVRVLRTAPPERFLICSDGLTGELTDQQIAAVLADALVPQDAADTLVRQAVEAGGHDNITAIVLDAVGDDDEDDTEVTVIRPWPGVAP